MNTQRRTHKMKRAACSSPLALTLATMVTAAMLASPRVAWSQTAEWTVYNTANSGLPYNGVTGLAIDAQGNIWIGTGRWFGYAGGGLAKFDGQNWTVYNTSNSDLPNNDHTGLSIDPQGNVWIGTEGGTLTKFDGQNWTVYRPTSSGQHASPSFDAQGNMWVGSYGGGLAKFDGENWTVYNTSNSGLPHNRAWATAIDAQGNVWIGTAGGGVAKFDGVDDWTVYNTSNSGLPHNNAAIASGSLGIDGQGNVWIATDGGGVARFDGVDDWTVYNTSNSGLPHNRAAGSLAIDRQGNVWIGTWGGGGLARFDGENWTVYNKSNSGLPDNRVYSLAIDAQGSVWIGTESGGLAVFRPAPVADFNADGEVDFQDFSMLAQDWRRDQSPSASHRVDCRDLAALSEYWLTYPGVVAHWKLDETGGFIVHDSVGDHDGFVLSANPLWRPTDGIVNGALEFDGVDDYVSTPSVLDPADGDFSIFAWIKGGAALQAVLSQIGAANWLLADAEGRLMTELKGVGRFSGPLYTETVITDGQWHRIALTWDGSNRTLYVDDVEVAADTESSLPGCNAGLYIGAGKDRQPGSSWQGLIDDVRIYDRAIVP